MSLATKKRITCSHCQKEFEIDTYSSINSELDTSLKENLISGKLFEHICPSCQEINYYGYPLLYHDSIHHFLIQYSSLKESRKILETFKDNTDKLNEIIPHFDQYIFRVVSDYSLLKEKINCLENELDDRLIEITKIFIGATLEKENRLSLDERVFIYKDNDSFKLEIVNLKTGHVHYLRSPLEIYQVVKDDFDVYLNDEETKFAIIDEEWASNIIQKVSQRKEN